MPHKGYESITIHEKLYNGLELEAEKQHRSVANLTELILKKSGIMELSDQEKKKLLEVVAK